MSTIFRDMANNKTNKHQWVLLDGGAWGSGRGLPRGAAAVVCRLLLPQGSCECSHAEPPHPALLVLQTSTPSGSNP